MSVTSSLRRVLSAKLASEPDAELLARFVSRRDEDAFAVLFNRHGPMVRAVCRRYCRDVHLADDAVQGVWLVLARRAAGVSRPERLANWLFGVAVRVGKKAAAAASRNRQAGVVPEVAMSDVAVSALADELLQVLDEELTALPEQERLPLVLCYLEVRTQDEAARQCGISLRTLRRWIDRGRTELRRRLERRGVAPAAALGALAVASTPAPASARVLATALSSEPVPSTLSPWIAEELAMTGTRSWWLRAALVAGLGLGGVTAAVWSAADKPIPATQASAATEPAPLPAGAAIRLGSTSFRHAGEVHGLAFAPDGKSVYALGDGAYSGWAVPDGRSLLAVDPRKKGELRYLTVISPDGKLAMELLSADGDPKLYAAEVTDLTTGKLVAEFVATRSEPQWPYSLSGAFSPDGSVVAIQNCAEVSLYSLPDGKLIRRLSQPRPFRDVVFTPDGKRLVTGSIERFSLAIWDATTGAELKTLDGGGTGTGCLSLSPDGKTAVAVGTRFDREPSPIGIGEVFREQRDNELVAWDLATGKIAHRVTADHPVQAVQVLGDGTVVGVVDPAATRGRSAVRRWRLSDGEALWSVAADHRIWRSAVSADGKWLATGAYTGLVVLWDVTTGKPRPRTDGHSAMIESITFSSDGKTILTTDATEMRTWDAATGKPGRRFTHPELVGFAQWDAAGKTVAAGANVINDDRRTVAVFEAATGRKLLTVTDPQRKKGFGFCGFGLSSDGTRLAVPVTKDEVVHYELWDVSAARRLWAAPMPDDWKPGGVVFTNDGRVLVGATDIVTLDATTGKQLDRRDLVKDALLPVDKSNNTQLYPSRDGRTLGFVIQWVGIFLVDSKSWKLLRKIDTPKETHWPLTFSPDGTRFATSNAWYDSGVRVRETATGKLLGRLDGSPTRVVEIAFSPDGRRLASGGIDGTALVWDLSGLK